MPAKKANGALDELKKLYQFMTEQGLERLEFSREGYQVRLVRRHAGSPGVVLAAPGPAAPQQAPAQHRAAAPARPALPPGAATVKSPMMGIFYRASTPSSPPFVKEGDAVRAGQVLCLIEAMKVFNEVKAEHDGRVVQVLVENGKPVQAGQDLLVVEKR